MDISNFSIDWNTLYSKSLNETNWDELFNIQDFKFKFGTTPFSQFQIIPAVLAIYLFTIFTIKAVMKNRPAFSLKGVVVAHNAILCLWSLVMCLGILYESVKRIQREGFFWTACEVNEGFDRGVSYYWSYIFYISKFYELFDTIIIVLKKRDLIFLHVYHHCIVVWLCWYFLYTGWSLQLWVVFLNTLVHVFMYYYYMNAARGIQVWWKKYITQIQIIQFCCLAAVGIAHFISLRTHGCVTNYSTYIAAYSINFSFLFLFTRFYTRSYDASKKSTPSTSSPIPNRAAKTKKID